MIRLSLGATWLVAFVIGWPPFFLVSIADVIAALVIAVVGIIWLLMLFIGSILGLVSLARSVV